MTELTLVEPEFSTVNPLGIETPGVEFTPTGLQLPDALPEQDWAEIGRKLLRSDQIMQWWIGDWAIFGAGDERQTGWRKHGALKQFCEANGLLDRYGDVRTKAWVSASVHLSLRRTNVDYSFFREIAPLKPKEQIKWLKKAETEEMSVGELRAQIRLSKGEANAAVADGPKMGFIEKGLDEFVSWWRGRPAGFWTEDRKAYWRQALRPIVEIWEGLA